MKIVIEAQTLERLKDMRTRLLEKNPHIEKSIGKIANAVIREGLSTCDEKRLVDLVGKLMSPRARKRHLRETLRKLTEGGHAEIIETIENGLKRAEHKLGKISKRSSYAGESKGPLTEDDEASF